MSDTDKRASQASATVQFAANDVRLSMRQFLAVAALIGLACWLIPLAWQLAKPLTVGPGYRLPYQLGNDYWSYEQACRKTCENDTTLLVGDSVLWGHYVAPENTLSYFLNQEAAEHRFVNLAVDGIHPTALFGLVKHYGSAIRAKRVIINCNLLWMSSPRHDLSSEKETPLNHPTLVPQFQPRIPCYNASVSERLSVVISRHVGIFAWADHLRIAYYGSDDLATWTIDHPYNSPLGPWADELPTPAEPPSPVPDTRPWTEKMIRPLSPEWVPLDESIQWQFFRRTVQLLKQRGNQVYVLIGPLNEHMLTERGLAEYEKRRQGVIDWHGESEIPCFVPPVLPSEVYADLSHPVADGYVELTKEMLDQKSFRVFLCWKKDE